MPHSVEWSPSIVIRNSSSHYHTKRVSADPILARETTLAPTSNKHTTLSDPRNSRGSNYSTSFESFASLLLEVSIPDRCERPRLSENHGLDGMRSRYSGTSRDIEYGEENSEALEIGGESAAKPDKKKRERPYHKYPLRNPIPSHPNLNSHSTPEAQTRHTSPASEVLTSASHRSNLRHKSLRLPQVTQLDPSIPSQGQSQRRNPIRRAFGMPRTRFASSEKDFFPGIPPS